MTALVRGPERAAEEHGSAPRQRFAHVPALDGLRGAAVAAVLLYHGGYLGGGYLGVDLFFVLSGYLITSLLLTEHDATGRIALSPFWIRRIRRLMPALLLMMVGVSLYAWLWARQIDLNSIRSDGLATLFYVANWHTILQGSSYWNISLAPSPLQHTWSLAIEEQFYLVWPFLVYGITRRAGRRSSSVLGWLTLALAALSTALFGFLYWSGASLTRIYEGTDTRATALLLGAAWAAWRLRVTAHVPRIVIEVVGIAAAVSLGYAWLVLGGTSPWLYRGGLQFCSGLAMLVIAAACQPDSPVLGRVFSVRPLAWLGLISYGLYLWHWPVYLVIDEQRLGHGGLALLASRLAVTLAIAVASFYLLERPVRRGEVGRGRRGTVLLAGGFTVALVALLVSTRGGVSVGTVSTDVWKAKAVVPGAPRVLVVGDSVAYSTVRPMLLDPTSFGVNPINGARIACSPLVVGHNWRDFTGTVPALPPSCTGGVRSAVAQLKPDMVLVVLGARPNDYIEVDGKFRRSCDDRYDRYFEDRVSAWMTDLGSQGAPVVIATVARAGKFSFLISGTAERTACENRSIERLPTRVPGLKVLDIDRVICPRGHCIERLHGGWVRRDGLHFSDGPGGAEAAKRVLREAQRLSGVR